MIVRNHHGPPKRVVDPDKSPVDPLHLEGSSPVAGEHLARGAAKLSYWSRLTVHGAAARTGRGQHLDARSACEGMYLGLRPRGVHCGGLVEVATAETSRTLDSRTVNLLYYVR
jgi:hypothetical protein